MIHQKPKNEIFASDAKAGEIVEFPNIKRGWGVTENLGFIPPMEYFNAAFNRVDKALAYQSQRGVSEWSADEEYPAGALSVFNGVLYQAKAQNSNKKPSENTSLWGVVINEVWAKTNLLGKDDGSLVCEYAHVTHSQVLPDGDYSSSDFWLSVRPGIYYAVSEKGRNKPANYGLIEVISNGEVSITWNYLGRVWKWYQGFDKSNSGWKKVVFGDVTPEARANSIVARNANGDFDGRYVNAEYFRMTNPTQNDTFTADCDIVYRINDSSNAYLRSAKLSKVASLLGGLGVRQTWQDVLSQRKFNVVYTNTTDKPIFVSIVSYPTPTSTPYVSFYVDGLLIARSETSGSEDNTQITAVVPSGSTYKMDNGGDNGTRLKAWTELR